MSSPHTVETACTPNPKPLMNRFTALLPALLLPLLLTGAAPREKPGPAQVYGRIQLVTALPDVKVKVVTALPDLRVKRVQSLALRPGEWQIVDSLPDYKVQMVDSLPDFTIQCVDSLPGLAR